ncbi:hypothetical protein [Halomonas colorata]|uniref:Uncharacterized protein n=1 Tax=Halomonas colorata TaxID=2742615 RepID=A0ABR9G375_9GAMM|nr:hypothetical protein [Halomonas colorata]MBE0465357.1 hypothetical protein [Halomonas colorata]
MKTKLAIAALILASSTNALASSPDYNPENNLEVCTRIEGLAKEALDLRIQGGTYTQLVSTFRPYQALLLEAFDYPLNQSRSSEELINAFGENMYRTCITGGMVFMNGQRLVILL